MATQPAVHLDNVTLSYARTPAVHHVSGSFICGSLTAIAGPNGAGKSTLLKGIAGVKPPASGRIQVNVPPSRIAYLPQAANLERDFPLNVRHLVAMGAWQRIGGSRAVSGVVKSEIADALGLVGLSGFENRSISSLSVGQFQRALFARLIMQDAQLILLDEPFNAVDSATTVHLLHIVKKWRDEGRTLICVLHDFQQIREHFEQCLLIARECVAWGNVMESLLPQHLAQAFLFRDVHSHSHELCPKAS